MTERVHAFSPGLINLPCWAGDRPLVDGRAVRDLCQGAILKVMRVNAPSMIGVATVRI